MSRRLAFIALVLAISLAGCAAPQVQTSAGTAAVPSAPKRIVAGISGDPPSIYATFGAAGVRGAEALNILTNSGLATDDHTRTLRPLLGETLPSVENGLWRVFPDGTMEVTWRIRNGARWHDGTPLTVDDLLFTAQVLRDRDLPFPMEATALTLLQDLQAVDAQTVRIRWTGLYVNADRVFGSIGLPLPKHLLEAPYLNNKPQFTTLPYWTLGYVGTGPFKLKEWVLGSYVVLGAFDGYALGRPKIDEIEIRFILDPNVLVSNVLAGDVDVTFGRSFSPDQGVLVRQQWQDGHVDIGVLSSALSIWPQLADPNPAITGDLRFRRALFQAIDRQTMADTLEGGLAPVAHSWLLPNIPEYRELEHYIVRYEYDPRAPNQAIEALGYTHGPDGTFRDSRGQRLAVELRSIALPEINQRSQLIAQADWQRAGVTVELDNAPAQNTDPSYYANFPGFFLVRYPADLFSGSGTIKNRMAPSSMVRYTHPEFDPLAERFESTMARRERLEITGQMVRHMTDQVTVMPLFYDPGIGFVRNRLLNVPTLGDSPPWNAYEWDVG